MARGKKTSVRPRRSASSLQASSEAISSQPDRPSSGASQSTQSALLLRAGSQPTHANQPAASQPPSEVVASTWEIDSETLGVFYEITLRVSISTHPTVHTTFQDVIAMEKNIKSMYVSTELATRAETRKILNEMAANMKNRWFKYYGSFHELNHIVIIGLVLDARFKLKNVTYTFNQEGLGDEEVERIQGDQKPFICSL
ncbi:hypothetical protein ACLB2K_074334 [Fragaria x ananassa]